MLSSLIVGRRGGTTYCLVQGNYIRNHSSSSSQTLYLSSNKCDTHLLLKLSIQVIPCVAFHIKLRLNEVRSKRQPLLQMKLMHS